MVHRAAVASILVFVLSIGSVSAGGSPVVQMLASSFSPSNLKLLVGETVTWDNNSGLGHTTTADRFSQWDRFVGNGADTDVMFARAGAFPYHCEIHANMTGTIKVRPTSSPSPGTVSTTFVIRVATASPPAGFVEDIQRRKGSNPFRKWKYGITAQTTTWAPESAGTWQFRARYRKTSTGAATGWSQPLTVQVN